MQIDILSRNSPESFRSIHSLNSNFLPEEEQDCTRTRSCYLLQHYRKCCLAIELFF